MIEETSSGYNYNFSLHTENINNDTDVSSIVELKKDPYNEENDISELLGSRAEVNQYEKINELYSKQILRVLRSLYFIILKLQENQIVCQMKRLDSSSDLYKELRYRQFHLIMQLTSFDDMNNYSNRMKSAFELLVSIIKECNPDEDVSKLFKVLESLKNYYRSDIMHKRSRKTILNLVVVIDESNITEHIKKAMLDVLEKNCWGTLDNVDAAKRFKFLLREPEFIEYLSKFQIALDLFCFNAHNNLSKNWKHVLKDVKNTKLKLLQICRELHKDLKLSFDYSYIFEKGNTWTRIPNILNLTDNLIDRVESPRVRHDFVQQSSHEVEMDQNNDFIKSDILPAEEPQENLRKTVHIELIDFDIEESNSNLPSKRSKVNDLSEKLNASSSDTSAAEGTKSKQIDEVDKYDVDDRASKFMIKNLDLAQKFMKGRQYGRENTPTRKELSKKQKTNLNKIKVKIDFMSKIPKAWEEDDGQISATSLDRVESLKLPNITKISKIKTDLKQTKSNLRVVRVTSARRSKQGNKHAQRQIASKQKIASKAFKLTRNKQELIDSNSGSYKSK